MCGLKIVYYIIAQRLSADTRVQLIMFNRFVENLQCDTIRYAGMSHAFKNKLKP